MARVLPGSSARSAGIGRLRAAAVWPCCRQMCARGLQLELPAGAQDSSVLAWMTSDQRLGSRSRRSLGPRDGGTAPARGTLGRRAAPAPGNSGLVCAPICLRDSARWRCDSDRSPELRRSLLLGAGPGRFNPSCAVPPDTVRKGQRTAPGRCA